MSLGISIYFGLENTFQENMDLLNDARELGYKKIFTSLHFMFQRLIIMK